MSVTAFVVDITPALAEQWLKMNTNNRLVREAHVVALSKAMLAGEWKLNGDTIRMNSSLLLDGQHRLMAVVRSGVTIQSLVVTGVSSDVFDTIDKGRKRTTGDTLHLRGEKHASLLAGTARALIELESCSMVILARSDKEIVDCINRHPSARDVISHNCGTRALRKLKIYPPSLYMAIRVLASEKDKTLADLFFAHIDDGDVFQPDEPVSILRERLIETRSTSRAHTREAVAILTIKAWNATRAGKKVGVLRALRDESIPVIA